MMMVDNPAVVRCLPIVPFAADLPFKRGRLLGCTSLRVFEMSSSSALFFSFFVFFFAAVFGCAPSDGTTPSDKAAVVATYNPPVGWTFTTTPGPGQAASEDAAKRSIENTIKAVIYDAAAEHAQTGVSIKILKIIPSVNAVILATDFADKTVTKYDPATGKTSTDAKAVDFTYATTISLQSSVPFTKSQWTAISEKVQSVLGREDFVGFSCTTCGVVCII
uniref:Lipoprotein n=1 Tax=Steinernema glaseri TaxID=37863 RepID=A0A1I7YMN2_9BILA